MSNKETPHLTFEEAREIKKTGLNQNSKLFGNYLGHIIHIITCVYPNKDGYFEIKNNKIEYYVYE